MSAAVLQFNDVTKRFGDFTAVKDLSFAVPEGSVYGFLGGNGAGKTTSLRMALDILAPTTGRIEILGAPPSREKAADIGFLPEERGLYRRMTVLDTVIYFGRLKGMTPTAARKSALSLLDRLDLIGREKTKISELSKGLAQKVQLATALVNAPRLIMLDEPFSGLDPVNQGVLEEAIKDAAKQGATVLFSTHVMQHAERLCERLLLLARGKKVFEGTQEEARAQLPSRLTVTSKADPSGLPGVSSARSVDAGDSGWTRYELVLAPGTGAGDILEACTTRSFALRSFDIHQPALHEVFIHLVGGEREIVQ
ncbi:MAG: ATP-binding cassette domain-containing protein [Sphingobium sp.]|nr:ATP-binding cassette domain-containing protein [Sphingobium sp.]